MTKEQLDSHISVDDEFFIPEKSCDRWKEVRFEYQYEIWEGALPKFLEKQGLNLTEDEFDSWIKESYELLNPSNRQSWIIESDSKWKKKGDPIYKVLAALYSGSWECRVCGPIPKVNPQGASRLRALKFKGYIIGSKRRMCSNCAKKNMHDILIMLPNIGARFSHGNNLRKPMSNNLKRRIKSLLGHKEVCFNVIRNKVELLIDHKFPSQRWSEPESDNLNDMSEVEIKAKFQLLSNQTNMWKSRHCDACVKTGVRGDFMGLRYYYIGSEIWAGETPNDEKGCIGCPWYDLEIWKKNLLEEVKKNNYIYVL